MTITVIGKAPSAAPIPEPGFYWLRRVSAKILPDAPKTGLFDCTYTWESPNLSDWFLAQVGDSYGGWYQPFGEDDSPSWKHQLGCIVAVSPRIEEPKAV